jgi:hypothetical protein
MADQQIRDLVHTVKSTDLTGSQISQAFGDIYLSNDSISNQLESQEIVAQFQTVKAPTFGCSIPNSTRITTTQGDSGPIAILVPTVNKTYAILAVDLINNGASPMTVSLGYYDGTTFVTLNVITVGATATGSFTTRNAYTFDSSVYPAFIVTSGTAADATVSMAYSELIQ